LAKALPSVALGKNPIGKAFFAESRLSGSRQRKDVVNGPALFAESPFGWLSAKSFLFFWKNSLPRASLARLSANIFLFF
jgi:hypothetical protein